MEVHQPAPRAGRMTAGAVILLALWSASGRSATVLPPDREFRQLDPRTDLASRPETGGRLEAAVDGRTVMFPTLKADVEAQIDGDLATVTVVQTFANPFDRPMHATYLFPLHRQAAVFEMTMEVGDERIRAVIREREEAVRTFEAAKSEGKTAALLQQHRPNMYTQDVANLMPGLPVKVTLRYVHAIDRQDDEYRLIVPLVVGPRYQPAGAGEPPRDAEAAPMSEDVTVQAGAWELDRLPAYPKVSGLDIPDTVDKERVSLRIQLNGGMPVQGIVSNTHPVRVESREGHRHEITLDGGRTIDNRDFVLRYRLGGRDLAAGLLASRDSRGGFFSLLLEPPPVPEEKDIAAREMVFVLDCSGSMYGQPMDASKAFMQAALRRLRAGDTFRIIRFSDAATEFSAAPLPATRANVEAGLRHIRGLSGEGGTEMSAGIRQALDVPVPPATLRIVTFLTDGYIGNEHEILSMIRSRIGDARLYAFGVGTAVNRYLLDKMGEMGRGFTRYMDPTEDLEAVAGELAARLDAPVLTDIEIDWGGLRPDMLAPERVPDLFAGNTVRVQGRYDRPGTYELRIKGRVGGRRATLPLKVVMPAEGGGEAIALLWARSAVEQSMDALSVPEAWREPRQTDDEIRAKVTELGIRHNLVTRWTSFVAVSERIYNQAPAEAVRTDVPLHQVKGVSDRAYGDKGGKTAAAGGPATQGAGLAPGGGGQTMLAMVGSFNGSSAPEPATLTALLATGLAAAASAAAARRRRRNPDGEDDHGE